MPKPKRLNPAYKPAYESEARYRLIFGGSGSGKSVFAAQEEVQRASRHEQQKTLIVRKAKVDIRDSCFEQIRQVLQANDALQRVNLRRQEMRITFPGGGEILGVGLDDAGRLKSIVDPTRVWIEEANQLSEGDFNELDRRLRGKLPEDLYYQLTLTFNPEMGRGHWIRDRFFKEGEKTIDDPDVFSLRTTYEDNPWVDEHYEKALERQGEEAKATYKEGKFYDSDEPDQLIKTKWVREAKGRDIPKTDRVSLGVDVARFGDDRTALVVMEGPVITEAITEENQSTTDTARLVRDAKKVYGVTEGEIAIDTGGLGAGVADTLDDMGIDFHAVKFGASPVEDRTYRESFFDFRILRDQLWWHIRRLVRDGEIGIDEPTEGARLTDDLTTPKYDIGSGRKIQVEPKRGDGDWGMRSRVGRSPDVGDAAALAAFTPRFGHSGNFGGALYSGRGNADHFDDEDEESSALVGTR